MAIQWNKVTWYSKLLAVVLFVAVFYVGYSLGQQKKEVDTQPGTSTTTPEKNVSPVSIQDKKIKEENFFGTAPVITGSSPLVALAQTYIDKTVSDFRAEANKDVPAMRKEFGADSPTAEYEIDITAKYIKSKNTESIVMEDYVYTGGAHGSSTYKTITVSTPDGKALALSDIIKYTEQTAFVDYVKKSLNAWRPEGMKSSPSPLFPEQVSALKFDSFQNFSLDDKNLVLYFSQYDIGPGVLGAMPFPLPLSEIKSFLK